jgi:hypothetical protein
VRIPILPLAIQTGAGAVDGALAITDVHRSTAANAPAGAGTSFTKQYTSYWQGGLLLGAIALGFAKVHQDVTESMAGSALTLLARRGAMAAMSHNASPAIMSQGYAAPRVAAGSGYATPAHAMGYQQRSPGGTLA